MARRSRRERCRCRSTPRPSPTIRPACIWCRACCWRCCSGEKTGRGQQFNVSLLDSMIAAQTQEAAAHLMRGTRAELGRDAAVRRVRDHATARWCMVGAFKADPAAGHRHRARHRGPRRTIRASRPTRCGWRTSRRCRRSSASASRPTPRRTGSARLEEQDLLCAPVRTPRRGARRRADGDQRHDPGGAGRGRDRARRRLADPPVGCAGDDPHSAGRRSASTPRRCWRSWRRHARPRPSDADPVRGRRITSRASRSTGRTC